MFSICPKCGELNDGQSTACRGCRSRLSPQSSAGATAPVSAPGVGPNIPTPSHVVTSRSPLPVLTPTPTSTPAVLSARSPLASPPFSTAVPSGAQRNQLSGEVLWADTARQEQRDWSFVQAMTAPLTFLGCLTIPFLLLFAALAHGQWLIVLFIGGMLFLAVRALSSKNLMTFLYLKTLLFPSSGSKENQLVPVQSFRVRTDRGVEKAVRMKGEPDASRAGHIGIGDQVTFWGDWKGGTLHSHRAYNHNTNAWTAVQRPRPWVLIVILVVIALLLCSLASNTGRSASHRSPSVPSSNSGRN